MSAMPEIDDRTVIDGLMFNFSAGIERFRECMKQYFPRDGRSIDKYVRTVRAANRVSGLYYTEKIHSNACSCARGFSLARAFFCVGQNARPLKF
jgi:all-trans-retinol 13,14-reductase